MKSKSVKCNSTSDKTHDSVQRAQVQTSAKSEPLEAEQGL